MEVRTAVSPRDLISYDTARLRQEFLLDNLFCSEIHMVYSQIDRIIVGGVSPVHETVLEAGKELGAEYFCQRREIGILNLGQSGIVEADGQKYVLKARECLYVGMGTRQIIFNSENPEEPAIFYFLSAPAHKSYPTMLIKAEGDPDDRTVIVKPENKITLGEEESSNRRTICKYIIPGQIESCQLCMGITSLMPGSVWNSMPCHTHDRRMEVYLYTDVPKGDIVLHLMGEEKQTRHLIMQNNQAVISPSWSIHAGCGTHAYSFVWGMCGENQDFDDMDRIETKNLQ
ncbi:MAG: 5-dehydro-4-deoxy-D-glucuronate isomerase [Lachnospiraceae bacterium]|nr:5-dehydro-4-deoxy-D-glucuronate isomerase [Lachnospiraceae bacterium]